MNNHQYRKGTILIIVAGLSGILASLAIAFLVRNRSDAQESDIFLQEVQARLMLVAACSYIQEASRIGWDDKNNRSAVHLETYGWIDVRDGSMGPKPFAESIANRTTSNAIRSTPFPVDSSPIDTRERTNRAVLAHALPVGVAKRFPFYTMKQPPYAIQNRAAYNPINQDSKAPDYLASHLRFPDPQPVNKNGWVKDLNNPAGTINNAEFGAWEIGDPTPRQESFGLSWFRLMREPNGATFLVTCGGGGTMGFRDWKEVLADPEGRALFPSQDFFMSASNNEVRLWYRVEWSPAIMAIDNHLIWHHGGGFDHYEQFPMNLSVRNNDPWGQLVHHNMGGTISLIQRLRKEPTYW